MFNGFTHVKIDLKQPIVLEADMEMKSFNIMVGPNNAGKSLCNKLNWATTLFFTSKLIADATGFKDDKTDEDTFQFIMDTTFDEQCFEGNFEFYVRDEVIKAPFYFIKFNINKGKVTNISMDYPDNVIPCGTPIYLSTFSRDFSTMELYLKTKKMMGIDNMTSLKDMEKLTEWFKLYDISAFESILNKINTTDNISKALSSVRTILDTTFELTSIEIDTEECKIYGMGNNKKMKRMSSFGAGEQSIIVMMLASL